MSTSDDQPTVGGLIGITNATTTIQDCVATGTIKVANKQMTANLIGFVNTQANISITANKVLFAITPIPTGEENDVIIRSLLLNYYIEDGKTLMLPFSNVKYDISLFTYPDGFLQIDKTTGENTPSMGGAFEATGVATADLQGQTVFTGWEAVNGKYPVPAGVNVPTINMADYLNAVAPEKPISEDTGDDDENPASGTTTTAKSETTAKPSTTEEPTNEDTTTTEAPATKKGGCRSTVGIAGLSVLALVAVAGVATFKKKENQ